MTTDYKVTELFCIIDEFCKHFDAEKSRVFFQLMFFLNLGAFGRCTGITFVDSTMIPVCHNLRRQLIAILSRIGVRTYKEKT